MTPQTKNNLPTMLVVFFFADKTRIMSSQMRKQAQRMSTREFY